MKATIEDCKQFMESLTSRNFSDIFSLKNVDDYISKEDKIKYASAINDGFRFSAVSNILAEIKNYGYIYNDEIQEEEINLPFINKIVDKANQSLEEGKFNDITSALQYGLIEVAKEENIIICAIDDRLSFETKRYSTHTYESLFNDCLQDAFDKGHISRDEYNEISNDFDEWIETAHPGYESYKCDAIGFDVEFTSDFGFDEPEIDNDEREL